MAELGHEPSSLEPSSFIWFYLFSPRLFCNMEIHFRGPGMEIVILPHCWEEVPKT